MNRIKIYTDGSWFMEENCAGLGVVMIGDKKYVFSRGFYNTTANRMELMAVILAIEKLPRVFGKDSKAIIYSDSKYVVNAIDRGWLENWAHADWKRYNKAELKNSDLWQRLYPLIIKHDVRIEWLAGHSGNIHHDMADEFARKAARSKKLICDRES